jgi:DNA-binding NarL/FixJ family response regulator
MTDLRLLVVADNLVARAGFAAVLAEQTGIAVVGQVSSADDPALYAPDVLVYDVGLNPSAERLAALSDSGVPVVLLLYDERSRLPVLPRAPYGVLLRDTAPDALLVALRAAAAGLVVLDPALAGTLVAAPPPGEEGGDSAPAADTLTPREHEVLALLAQGLANKTIARRLSISDSTVKFHVNAIMTKLGAQSRTDAVVRATRLGLVML